MRYLRPLIAFTASFFWPAVVFGTVLFCLVPLALGLAGRAFFDDPSWTALALIVAVQLVEVLTDLALSRAWSGFMLKTHTLLQRNLLAGILRGFGRHGLTVPPGDALARFREDPPTITMGSMDGVCDLIGRGAFAVVAAVVMWRVEPLMMVAAFAPVVAAAAVSDALGTRSSRYGAQALDSTTTLSRFLGEVINGQLAVRVAGAEDRVVAHLVDIGERRRRLSLRDHVFAEIVNSMNTHLVHVSTGVVLLLGAGSLRDGRFTIGEFAMFVVFLDQLTYLPAEIGRVITELKRTAVSIGRMHALVPGDTEDAVVAAAPVHLRTAPPPLGDPPVCDEPLQQLDVRGLTCRHPSSGRGITDVSFRLERGTFTVVTGRIGSGKSTLLHAVLGLLPVEHGTIHWNGAAIDDPSAFLVPPRAAFTPQVPRLFSERLGDNLLLGRREDAAAVGAAVHAAVLERDVATFDDGLDTFVGPRGVKLSGGQIQRAAAARMFVREPQLLVFDDLSSSLDATTEAELWARLFSRGRDVTCLVVSHSPIALGHADQLVVLEDGRVTEVAPNRRAEPR